MREKEELTRYVTFTVNIKNETSQMQRLRDEEAFHRFMRQILTPMQ